MIELPQILETITMAAFGASWPLNVLKSYKARTAKGKSLFFLILIEIGYCVGIAAKIMKQEWLVLALYVFNFLMVSLDLCLYARNRKLDKAAEAAGKEGPIRV